MGKCQNVLVGWECATCVIEVQWCDDKVCELAQKYCLVFLSVIFVVRKKV